jgi:hypothetical protein
MGGRHAENYFLCERLVRFGDAMVYVRSNGPATGTTRNIT